MRIITVPLNTFPDGYKTVNVTSRSTSIYRDLSPFYLKDAIQPDANIENLWQYSKLYDCHQPGTVYTDNHETFVVQMPYGLTETITLREILPSKEWLGWNQTIHGKVWADHHPMGHKRPIHGVFEHKGRYYECDCIQSRKLIYVPRYALAATQSPTYQALLKLSKEHDIALQDFDWCNMSQRPKEIINDPRHRMGHAAVLAMCLSGAYAPKFPFEKQERSESL